MVKFSVYLNKHVFVMLTTITSSSKFIQRPAVKQIQKLSVSLNGIRVSLPDLRLERDFRIKHSFRFSFFCVFLVSRGNLLDCYFTESVM